MKKPTKAQRQQSERIAQAVALLEPHRGDAEAVRGNLPGTFAEVWGVPLDMADPHQLMLTGIIFSQLVDEPE